MNPTLITLARRPDVGRALLVSALLSLLSVGGTALAFVTAAQLVAGALLSGLQPEAGQLALLGAGLLARAAGQSGREWVGSALAARSIAQLRRELSGAALRLGPVLLAGRRSSDLAALDSELHRFQPFFARFLPGAVHAVIAVAGVLGVTLWLDPSTAALLAVTGPVTALFLYLVGLAAARTAEEQWVTHTRLGARVVTLVQHLPTLHAFGAVQPYREVLRQSAEAHEQTTMRVLRTAFLSGFVIEFAGTLSTALIAVWIGVRLFGAEVVLAPALAALMLVAEFFGPLRQLGADRHAAMDAAPLAERWAEVVGAPLAASGHVQLTREGGKPPALTFSGARADLGPGAALSPVSAQLAPGTHAALRGPSGSGKSSLLHALYLAAPYLGSVTVSGSGIGSVPLRELDREAWQRRVAFVPQHPRLIAGSVEDNLRLTRPEAPAAELRAAAEAVGLGPVIGQLPGGYSAALGEGGIQLSGGETARLALARALVSGADILLLDEITAHLDCSTEADILALMASACAGRTVLLATHRDVPAGWQDIRLDLAQGNSQQPSAVLGSLEVTGSGAVKAGTA